MVAYNTVIKRMEIKLQHTGNLKEINNNNNNNKRNLNLFLFGLKNKYRGKKSWIKKKAMSFLKKTLWEEKTDEYFENVLTFKQLEHSNWNKNTPSIKNY